MVKRYVQTSGALVEAFNTFDGKPSGEWVEHKDYLALQTALKEALEGWEDLCAGGYSVDRIEELRKQFLDI